MAYDSVRAQLDKLLGVDRNGPLTDSANNEPPNYRDAKFCKHFLLGFCPNDLYIKQRSEPGSCRLEHSEAAKSAFEKDEAEGRVREEERFRWMRALLSECRTIVGEEDRKIRGQARRLQESYGCGGDLSGLMIRNFDTLKKLGMVRQNARIRVLSEMDDSELTSEGGVTLAQSSRGPSADANVESIANPVEKKTSDVPNEIQPASAQDEKPIKAKGSESDTEKETGEEDDDDDDDDMDGFGLIKVIPAGNSPIKDGEEESAAPVENGAAVHSKASSSQGDPTMINKDSPLQQNELNPAERGKGDKHALDDDSDKKQLPAPQEKDVDLRSQFDKHNETGATPSKAENNLEVERSQMNFGEKKSRAGQVSGSKLTANGKEEENNVMDKFYETGAGPDGLLMLDRKQSKRVCACCGGYISLVDAESRLLSHYGGKSHHSLAQLRAKIPEVEAALAKAPRYPHETNSARHGGYDDRDYGRSRNNDGGRSRGDYRSSKRGSRYDDRYRDSYSGRSQHSSYRRQGGSEWNSNSGDGYDNRYGSRYKNDDFDNDRSAGRHDRYHGRRKRYRSPSPHRESRRRRSYY